MSDTILLVEDSPDDVVFITRAFAKTGLLTALRVVSDGQEAMDYIGGTGRFSVRLDHPLPRLLLLDLKLPHASGFEVLRWIRARREFIGIVVVMLTASDHPADIRESYSLGANSYLSKPSNPEHLTELVRDVANYWLRTNVPAPKALLGEPAVDSARAESL